MKPNKLKAPTVVHGSGALSTNSQVMRNVKKVSHPKNTTVHKLLDARSYKGCIVAGSNPVLTTQGFSISVDIVNR
jgi:hypothetical protein